MVTRHQNEARGGGMPWALADKTLKGGGGHAARPVWLAYHARCPPPPWPKSLRARPPFSVLHFPGSTSQGYQDVSSTESRLGSIPEIVGYTTFFLPTRHCDLLGLDSTGVAVQLYLDTTWRMARAQTSSMRHPSTTSSSCSPS